MMVDVSSHRNGYLVEGFEGNEPVLVRFIKTVSELFDFIESDEVEDVNYLS
jgi:hypothetical protein